MWSYRNAISVPLFNRIGLPVELMGEGTWLHFEYRELTEEEKNRKLFQPDEPVICPALFGPPPANTYEKSGFPDQTEELTEKLSSAEFRNTLKKEYETFLQDYDTDPSILRFHYHKLNDILQRIQDLEILRKELTSSLTKKIGRAHV